jgi:hypothetical protein
MKQGRNRLVAAVAADRAAAVVLAVAAGVAAAAVDLGRGVSRAGSFAHLFK